MKKLKNCIELACSVKIYVPSTINIDKHFENDFWINETLAFLSTEFGGATSTKALGAWLSQSGNLIKEDVTIVFSFVSQDTLEKKIEKIYEFCLRMKIDLSQESVALEINNKLYLI